MQTIQSSNNANLSARAEILKIAFANQMQKKHANDEQCPLDVDSNVAFNRKESCLKKWGVPMKNKHPAGPSYHRAPGGGGAASKAN